MKKLLAFGKTFFKENKKFMSASLAVMCAMCMFAVPASAAAEETVSWTTFSGVLDSLTAQVNVTNVVAILASLVGAAVGLAFMWWGVRKLIRVIMAAFKKGKVSV